MNWGRLTAGGGWANDQGASDWGHLTWIWHNRLNQRSQNGNLNVYQLVVPLLHDEVQFVTVQAVLVTKRHLLWYQQCANIA